MTPKAVAGAAAAAFANDTSDTTCNAAGVCSCLVWCCCAEACNARACVRHLYLH